MGFDWEGILGEDGYRSVCNHGLDCYGYSRRSESYSYFSSCDDYYEESDDSDYEGFVEDGFCEDELDKYED